MPIFLLDKIIKNKLKTTNKFVSIEEYQKKWTEKIYSIAQLYFTGISEKYIKSLLDKHNKIKILFITIGQNLNINDIVGIIFYHKTSLKNTNKYYILCFGIHKKFRKFGYGKYTLDEFVQWIKLNDKSTKQKNILLKSIESSLFFYKNYGFIETDLIKNKFFFKYEPNEELKNNSNKILEFKIN